MHSFEDFLRDLALGEHSHDKHRDSNKYSPMLLLCIGEELDIIERVYPEEDQADSSHSYTYTLNEAGRDLYRRVLGEEPPRPYWEEFAPPTDEAQPSPEA